MAVTTQGNPYHNKSGQSYYKLGHIYYKLGQLLQTGAQQLLLIRYIYCKVFEFLEEYVILKGCQGLLKNKEIRFFLYSLAKLNFVK